MSVLFCLWADKEEERGDDPEENIEEPREYEDVKNTREKELGEGCENITSEASINDANVKISASDTAGKSYENKAEVSSSSNREPEVKAVTKVDEIPVKDCLRAPGMFFSLWKDQEEEWESEVSEVESEEDDRPKFFSFAESQDGDALGDEEGSDEVKSETEVKDSELDNEEDSCDIKEARSEEDQNEDEIVDDNLDVCAHDELETESDFSVDDLVIQKVETTASVKVEHESATVEAEDKLSKPKPVRKTFARKSTAPSRSVVGVDVTKTPLSKAVASKPNKRKAEKADKMVAVSRSRRIRSAKAASKAAAPHQHIKPSRSRRMVECTDSRNVKVKIGENRTEFGDEVKLEAEEDEDPVDMCNLITDTIEVEENIKQLKMEENDNIDIPEDESYEYSSLGDPLGDPLSTQFCSSITDRPFLWPKLDPLFHTVTEFKLSREFAKLIRALEKPTAKIQPLMRPTLSQLKIKTDVKDEVRQETPPAPAVSSRPQRIRKRKMPHGVPSSELKSLLSPSYVHDPPAIKLPNRRRSLRQEDKVEQEQTVEEETVSRKRKRKPSHPVVPAPEPGHPPRQRSKKAKAVVAKKVARPDVSVVGSVSVCGGGEYMVVCKTGDYECPLCSTRWSLNQTYGRHVVTRTCQVQQDRAALSSAPWILAEADHDEDLAVLTESISPRNNIFVFVNPATVRKDSYVSTSHVPSLKLLCRGAMPRACSAPPIRVKEGLEYYHALVWPDNNKEEVVFKYMSRLAKITMVTSVGEYEKLCREPLKVALYLEKKISKSREKVGHRHSQTRRWVEKYTLYLTFPLHDIFLVVSQAGYRVLEFPLKEGKVGLLCLVCPTMSCKGCLSKQSTKLPTWQPGKKPPLKVAIRTLPKVRKDKPLKPVVTNPSARAVPAPQKPPPPTEPKLPPLQLHICSPCKTVFNSRLALSSHRGLCRGAMGE